MFLTKKARSRIFRSTLATLVALAFSTVLLADADDNCATTDAAKLIPGAEINRYWRNILRKTNWDFQYFDENDSKFVSLDAVIRFNFLRGSGADYEIKKIGFFEINEDGGRDEIKKLVVDLSKGFKISSGQGELDFWFQYEDPSDAAFPDMIGKMKIFFNEDGKSFNYESCHLVLSPSTSGHSKGGGRGN